MTLFQFENDLLVIWLNRKKQTFTKEQLAEMIQEQVDFMGETPFSYSLVPNNADLSRKAKKILGSKELKSVFKIHFATS